jgi:hypothetical protein
MKEIFYENHGKILMTLFWAASPLGKRGGHPHNKSKLLEIKRNYKE